MVAGGLVGIASTAVAKFQVLTFLAFARDIGANVAEVLNDL